MKPTILIVDDEQWMRASLGELLQAEGYGVLLADSAASAMELLDRSAPDIAILDVRMPERGGLELLKDLRALSPNLRVFMMTGYPSVDTAVLAMKYGAMDFSPNPSIFPNCVDS